MPTTTTEVIAMKDLRKTKTTGQKRSGRNNAEYMKENIRNTYKQAKEKWLKEESVWIKGGRSQMCLPSCRKR